jgi:hypothetical protein
MKKFFLLIFVIVQCIPAYSQKVHTLSNVLPLKRGSVITTEGKKVEFRTLRVVNDTVIVSGKTYANKKIPGKEVYKISRTGNSALVAALSCGAGGCLGAVVGTMNWTGDLEKSKGTYIVVSTLACTALGGIIGVFIPRDIMIYRNNAPISFLPNLYFDHNQTYITARVRIRI